MADDFYSFDEALNELKLKEEELKRLVSEGEIRAFRKGDTMKLRRADVEELRAELDGDLVDLGDTVDELVFEDETDLGDAGMKTQELDVETLVDEPVEELELDEIDAAASSRRSRSRSGGSSKGGGSKRSEAKPAAPVRRTSAVAAARAEEEEEPTWVKGMAVLTALVLFLAAPIMVSLVTGSAGGLAKGIAGIFGQQFDQEVESATGDGGDEDPAAK